MSLNFAVAGVFLSLTSGAILHAILEEDAVTLDTISGGVCVYLLLGMIWMLALSALEYTAPGSLLENGVAIAELNRGAAESARFPQLLYFSFVTLTTLGYGDIVPATPQAQALCAGEAIVGQLYIAIFVARLVGLHIAGSLGNFAATEFSAKRES